MLACDKEMEGDCDVSKVRTKSKPVFLTTECGHWFPSMADFAYCKPLLRCQTCTLFISPPVLLPAATHCISNQSNVVLVNKAPAL